MAKREWDVPKRDLLDIERTAQAGSVEAADRLADAVEAIFAPDYGDVEAIRQAGVFLRQALQAYRIARGQDTGSAVEPWTAAEILNREG